jgi:hypothetical protein
MKQFKEHPVYHKLQHYHIILTPQLLQTNQKKVGEKRDAGQSGNPKVYSDHQSCYERH